MIDLFFDLIRVAVGVADRLSRVPTEDEWEQLFDMANKQALVGVCMSGVEHLPYSQWPPMMLKYQWIAYTSSIEDTNKTQIQQCEELTERFAAAGFRTCVLKGQSNGELYKVKRAGQGKPVAEDLGLRRQSGDIDLWVEGKRKTIVRFLRQTGEVGEVVYHHIDFHCYEDTAIEVHTTPTWMYSPAKNSRLQAFFAAHADDCFSGAVKRHSGRPAHRFNVPTWEVNVVFQLSHIFRHAFNEGVGLRQVMDYYFLLLQRADRGDMTEANSALGDGHRLEMVLRRLGLYKFATALMWVLGEVFRLETTKMIVRPDEKEGRWLLDEIVNGGNFGHFGGTTYYKGGTWHSFVQKNRRNLRLLTRYPGETLWAPAWRVWHFVWRKVCVKL